jgi:hypothetical protein
MENEFDSEEDEFVVMFLICCNTQRKIFCEVSIDLNKVWFLK